MIADDKNITIAEVDDVSSQYDNPALPYITFGMNYYEIRDALNSPNSIIKKNGYFYAYWGTSYILFDEKKAVIDWENNGGHFQTSTRTGKETIMWQNLYESIYGEEQ